MSQTKTALTTAQVDAILEGIVLGRSLVQIEKALKVDMGAFLSLSMEDEGINLRLKQARELSAYVLESEIDELLRENVESPTSAVKNTALKLRAEFLQWSAGVRNAAIYSGKAPISLSVPVHIETTLDLGQQKTIEGVYNLVAEHVVDVDLTAIPPESVISAGDEPTKSSISTGEHPKQLLAPPENPFSEAIPIEQDVGGESGGVRPEGQESVEDRTPRPVEIAGQTGQDSGQPATEEALLSQEPAQTRGAKTKRPRRKASKAGVSS